MIADILLSALIAVLVYISYLDVATHRIANSWVLVVAGLFVPFALAAHMSLADVGTHFAAGFVILAAGFVLFSAGLRIGGGDIKLFATLSLWCGFDRLLAFFVVMCFAGGVVALLVFGLRHFGVPAWLVARGRYVPALALEAEKSYVPYAPAMAFGFIYVAHWGLRL